jgi:hypothetical protein
MPSLITLSYPSLTEITSNPLLLDQLLAPARTVLDNYIRGVLVGSEIPDARFVRLGVLRVLSQARSGRDFLQQCQETFHEELHRSSFFAVLHSRRREQILRELNEQLVQRATPDCQSAKVDLLGAFPELRHRAIFAVDGHLLEHACHSARDAKGSHVPPNNLYLLCLHSGLALNLAPVQGDGSYGHEMPVFRRGVVEWLRRRGLGRKTLPIFVGDPAYVDKQFWTRMALWAQHGALVITRMKENMKPMVFGTVAWDKAAEVNAGVLADELVGFDGACAMRRVRYRDPETLQEYEFLTTERTLPPGLIALLYLLRWRIEKLFDTGKNKLQETKMWATGEVAREVQGHFFVLTHNLLVLLGRELDRSHGLREEKLEEKRAKALNQRAKNAESKGRKVPPVYWRLPVVQLSLQYIRAIRNGIWGQQRWAKALPRLAIVLQAYL